LLFIRSNSDSILSYEGEENVTIPPVIIVLTLLLLRTDIVNALLKKNLPSEEIDILYLFKSDSSNIKGLNLPTLSSFLV